MDKDINIAILEELKQIANEIFSNNHKDIYKMKTSSK